MYRVVSRNESEPKRKKSTRCGGIKQSKGGLFTNKDMWRERASHKQRYVHIDSELGEKGWREQIKENENNKRIEKHTVDDSGDEKVQL